MPKYIYPPRAERVLPPARLPREEKRGVWLWQHKFNGDRCVVRVENGKIYLSNRHGRFHHTGFCPKLGKELLSLDLPQGTTLLDGELLHPQRDQTVVLFDVLQYRDYLYGVKQLERLSLLEAICRRPSQACEIGIALQVTEHVWMARWGDCDFVAHYQEYIASKFIEGLILRKREAALDRWGEIGYEVDWMVRCRKPSKNYRF